MTLRLVATAAIPVPAAAEGHGGGGHAAASAPGTPKQGPGIRRLPGAPLDSVRRSQSRQLFLHSVMFSLAGPVAALSFSVATGGLHRPTVALANAALLLVYALIGCSAFAWRKQPNDALFLRRGLILYVCLGVSWGGLLNALALGAAPSQYAAVVALTTASLATVMLSTPLTVSLGYCLPLAALGVIPVCIVDPADRALAVFAYAVFVCFVIAATLFSNRTLKELWAARVVMQREHRTISLFLREYEESGSDWVWETDPDGVLVSAGSRLYETSRIGREHVVGLAFASLFEPGSTGAGLDATLADYIARRTPFRNLEAVAHWGGRSVWLSLTGHPTFDADGRFRGFLGIGADVTSAKVAAARIQFLAEHDDLTGLWNRRMFLARFETSLVEGADLALLVLDLDGFKSINDLYGHGVGDVLLDVVGTRILGRLRAGDIAGRTGGDEFAILLRTRGPADALAFAAAMIDIVGAPCAANGIEITPGVSIGIALAPLQGTDTKNLFARADLALYESKRRGKRVAHLFTDAMEQDHMARLEKSADIAGAIERGEMFVEYQPIFELASGSVVAAEALVRWQHPRLGRLNAGDFIPLIEGSRDIERLGEFVLREACSTARAWPALVGINVNLSPQQLRSGDFADIVKSALDWSGLRPRRLSFEITETAFVDRSAKILSQIERIRLIGVGVVLDDFGTGYSSLSYLQYIDVDGIKLDAMFTRNLGREDDEFSARRVAAIIRTIVRLAGDLNLFLVAEGIEREAQVDWLRNNGIPFAQGFLLGRPERDLAFGEAMLTEAAGSATVTG